MLRIGKNPKDQEDSEHAADKQDATAYGAARSYGSYQGTDTQGKPATDPVSASRALTESETLAKDIKEGTLSGFVGNGTLVTGETTFKAMLRVDGHLSGRISSSSGTLIIGTNGLVDANIEVANATIHGTVNGDIIAAQRLELGRAARVNGNIQTPQLVIEQGAIFEGACKMAQASAALEKSKSQKSEDRPLDVTNMVASVKPVGVDSKLEPATMSSLSKVAS